MFLNRGIISLSGRKGNYLENGLSRERLVKRRPDCRLLE